MGAMNKQMVHKFLTIFFFDNLGNLSKEVPFGLTSS